MNQDKRIIRLIEHLESLTEKKIILENKKGEISYPSNHIPGIKVPKGGSCCMKCKYWTGDECENKYYIKWNGSGKIPTSPDQYCSDWFETK